MRPITFRLLLSGLAIRIELELSRRPGMDQRPSAAALRRGLRESLDQRLLQDLGLADSRRGEASGAPALAGAIPGCPGCDRDGIAVPGFEPCRLPGNLQPRL